VSANGGGEFAGDSCRPVGTLIEPVNEERFRERVLCEPSRQPHACDTCACRAESDSSAEFFGRPDLRRRVSSNDRLEERLRFRGDLQIAAADEIEQDAINSRLYFCIGTVSGSETAVEGSHEEGAIFWSRVRD